jgi:chemotaxis-related protein WspB
MLSLLLSAGPHRCALPCRGVREVISSVELSPLAGAPRHVAGVFSYRGVVTPVADLCVIMTGQPCSRRLSSRIILFDFALGSGPVRPVGLLAERVTETRELTGEQAAPTELPYAGKVVVEGDQMISLLDPRDLLLRAFQMLPVLMEGGGGLLHAADEHRQ